MSVSPTSQYHAPSTCQNVDGSWVDADPLAANRVTFLDPIQGELVGDADCAREVQDCDALAVRIMH